VLRLEAPVVARRQVVAAGECTPEGLGECALVALGEVPRRQVVAAAGECMVAVEVAEESTMGGKE
jgi:hypothetical protein